MAKRVYTLVNAICQNEELWRFHLVKTNDKDEIEDSRAFNVNISDFNKPNILKRQYPECWSALQEGIKLIKSVKTPKTGQTVAPNKRNK